VVYLIILKEIAVIGFLKRIFGGASDVKLPAPQLYLVKPEVPASSVTVQVDRPKIDTAALVLAGLGSHHWAMTPRGVGVVTDCQDGNVTVNLSKSDGTNKMVLNDKDQAVIDQFKGRLSEVRRAYFDEMPNRNPDVADYEAHIRKCGYIHSSEATK
jgi:hypothetical protein